EPNEPVRQTSANSAEPAAPLPEDRLELLAEKKRLEDKLNSGSYPGEDADHSRLDEINRKLASIAATETVVKPAPLPPDEETMQKRGGGGVKKSYKGGRARNADKERKKNSPSMANHQGTGGGTKSGSPPPPPQPPSSSNLGSASGGGTQRGFPPPP